MSHFSSWGNVLLPTFISDFYGAPLLLSWCLPLPSDVCLGSYLCFRDFVAYIALRYRSCFLFATAAIDAHLCIRNLYVHPCNPGHFLLRPYVATYAKQVLTHTLTIVGLRVTRKGMAPADCCN
jgi:hypothetical protein